MNPAGSPFGSPVLVRWLSPRQLARHWGVSTRTIRRRIASGELPVHRVNARVYRISEIDAAAAYAARSCDQLRTNGPLSAGRLRPGA